MPLGDAFVRFLLRAWTIQDDRRREITTPKFARLTNSQLDCG